MSVDRLAPDPPLDLEAELAKISNDCLSQAEHEELAGGFVKYMLAFVVNEFQVPEAVQVIGLTELRQLLGLPPPGPWTTFHQPNQTEIDAAPDLRTYYELSEPRSYRRSLDSFQLVEKSMAPAIAFLDRRLPSIRTIFRRQFREFRARPGAPATVNRAEVDGLIESFNYISERIVREYSYPNHHYECIFNRDKR